MMDFESHITPMLQLPEAQVLSLPKTIENLTSHIPKWREWAVDRAASVAVLFICHNESPANIVLTRRSITVGSHKGQIGFPGGRREAHDSSPAATALRELQEEIGIDPAYVRVHGHLPTILALDSHPVIPIVMSIDARNFNTTISYDEVAALFLEPWYSFARTQNLPFSFNIYGKWRQSALFKTEAGIEVWGMTAAILQNMNMEP